MNILIKSLDMLSKGLEVIKKSPTPSKNALIEVSASALTVIFCVKGMIRDGAIGKEKGEKAWNTVCIFL